MKQMKIALVAMLAIFMGTTFTSCLDSDNSPNTYTDIVNFDSSFEFTGKVSSDAGHTLEIQNPSNMKGTDGYYPERAMIGWQEVEGADYTAGQKSYKAYFTQYYVIYEKGQTWMSDVSSVTPINKIESNVIGIGASGGYMNIAFNITYEEDNITPKSDLIFHPYEVKNGVLYCKIVQTKAVDTSKAKTGSLYMSFPLPSRSQLQSSSLLDKLELTGEDKNIYKLVITADGPNEILLESAQFAAILP